MPSIKRAVLVSVSFEAKLRGIVNKLLCKLNGVLYKNVWVDFVGSGLYLRSGISLLLFATHHTFLSPCPPALWM